MNSSYGRFRQPRARARPPGPPAALRRWQACRDPGPLAKACLPKDEASNFIAERERSDVVHDLLAFLAERMQEIKGFLGWLESYLGTKVEDLTPKTKLHGYYEHDYEDFLAVLKRTARSWSPKHVREIYFFHYVFEWIGLKLF